MGDVQTAERKDIRVADKLGGCQNDPDERK